MSGLQIYKEWLRYIYVCVCDSKAIEGKCDLLKSLRKMFVSNPSPPCGEEVLVSTAEAGPNAHPQPVGQAVFTRMLGGDQTKSFAGTWVLGSLSPCPSWWRKEKKWKKGEEFEQHKSWVRKSRIRLSVSQDEETVLRKQHVVVLISVRDETVKKGKELTKAKLQWKKNNTTQQRKIE